MNLVEVESFRNLLAREHVKIRNKIRNNIITLYNDIPFVDFVAGESNDQNYQ